jgi:formylglycine-generating enzyme required for sulfatase activity
MSDELIDRRLGQYLITEVIAYGGMATVYKATQPSLDRLVAIKVLRHDADPQFAARFKREARATAALQHHNILPIYDYNEQEGLFYLVLQYVEDGRTLASLLGRPMAPLAALRLMSHVFDALDYAHKRGIIHRDIKPTNILMPSPTWPMLADFGIAKLMNDAQMRLTLSDQIIGTATYMAPEQITGRAVDARTDLYSAAVVLYELVTGCVPFEADTPAAMMHKHVHEAPPPPRSLNPDVPAALETLLLRALAKDPNQRYQSIAEIAAEMERMAHELNRNRERSKITSLYEGGVQAFEQGHWDEAIERLDELVTLAPGYEDAADLLAVAREAQRRARAEALRQITRMRERRRRTDQQLTPAPAVTDETSQLAPRAEAAAAITPAPAVTDETSRLAPRAEAAAAITPAPTLPATPAAAPRRWRAYAPWVAGAAVVIALAVLLMRGFAAPEGDRRATAEPAASAAPAVVVVPTVEAPTIAPTVQVPTIAPTAVPLPAPVGKQVYVDHFDDPNASGLENDIKAPDFQRGFHPGVYHLRVLTANTTRVELLARRIYQDFSAQIDLNDNSDNFSGAVSQGLIFRARDREHYYALLIDPRGGRYALRRQDGVGKTTDLIPWTPSSLIKQAQSVNQLRVDAVGSKLTFYLNGAQLDEASDGTYGLGMLGMIVANLDATQSHMHFDNLLVWSRDTSRPPSLPPTRKHPKGDMVLISGGEFVLGSNDSASEPPQILAVRDFYLDRAEVTNALYRQCVAASACTPLQSPASQSHPDYASDPNFDNYPVINVSWQQANAFCGWAQKRLPTEAEWEKAASWSSSAREKFAWPWSNTFDPKLLNSDESKLFDTTAVGSYPRELNGTFDMAGNVSEWTGSLARPYPYDAEDGREDASAAGQRIYRGGSWAQTKGKARATRREAAEPDVPFNEVGFRCAASP